jgi:hypothetical protein
MFCIRNFFMRQNYPASACLYACVRANIRRLFVLWSWSTKGMTVWVRPSHIQTRVMTHEIFSIYDDRRKVGWPHGHHQWCSVWTRMHRTHIEASPPTPGHRHILIVNIKKRKRSTFYLILYRNLKLPVNWKTRNLSYVNFQDQSNYIPLRPKQVARMLESILLTCGSRSTCLEFLLSLSPAILLNV